jgi:predicted neutral ceramidase superfamily lipid hydrolase
MVELRKVVAVACLTYVIYGVTSAFQLGSFLPPIPVKPFIYLLFVLTGLLYATQKRFTLFSYLLLGWLFLLAINSNAFLETILSEDAMLAYESSISVYVSLITVLIFFLHGLVFLKNLFQFDWRFWTLLLLLIFGITYQFYDSAHFPFHAIIISWGVVVYFTDRIFSEEKPKLFQLIPIYFGVATIELIDVIVFNL